MRIYVSFHKFNYWAQDVSYYPEKSILCVCALEISGFHITLA